MSFYLILRVQAFALFEEFLRFPECLFVMLRFRVVELRPDFAQRHVEKLPRERASARAAASIGVVSAHDKLDVQICLTCCALDQCTGDDARGWLVSPGRLR